VIEQAKMISIIVTQAVSTLLVTVTIAFAGPNGVQEPAQNAAPERAADRTGTLAAYVLGPEDQVTIWALGMEDISEKPFRVDSAGNIDLPLIGMVHAAGMTTDDLKATLVVRLRKYVNEPVLSVRITTFKSQPISIIGAVKDPGVHYLEGQKTFIEVLAMAGGVRPDAGNTVKITRDIEWGRIPLPATVEDSTGRFNIGEVSLKAVMEARNPDENIIIKPNDVISVPRAELIYVLGEVTKPGGFVLNERETFSVLQALSMAGGVTPMAATQHARILRASSGGEERTEISVNLKRILAGGDEDVSLRPDDILFVPHSAARTVGVRAIEAAIGIGTGIIIWRH